MKLITHNRIKYFILFGTAIVFLLSMGLTAQSDDILNKARQYYKPDTWQKSDKQPLAGLKLDDFAISGFNLKEKRVHTPTGGTDYIWFDKDANASLHVIVNIYSSTNIAREKFLTWLITGVNIPLQKGTFFSNLTVIGDISWADSNSSLLAFSRDNVFIIIHGRPNVVSDCQIIESIANNLDKAIIELPRPDNGTEVIKMTRPVIESLKIEKTKLKLNETVLITVKAHDPRGEKLDYNFYATGGNILQTKQGYLYQAVKPGKHTITVSAVNTSNLRSEGTISVTVGK